MTARAFIVAIEDYSDSTSLATQLPGTNKDAKAFRDWFLETKLKPKNEEERKKAEASILACAGPSCEWRTTGTTHDEIVKELLKMVKDWKDKTDELYFYFSGHGFSYKNVSAVVQVDVLVASDFVDPENSGDTCLLLQEIQQKLWNALGPGNHYYFVDACRNPISIEDIEVPILGKKFPTSVRGRSNWYVLYSTALGQVAKVQSGFTQLLLKGLTGTGKAKKWESGKMYVTFERLRDYVKTNLQGQESEAKTVADADGFILELSPVPQSTCEVIVDNASEQDSFTLKVSNDLMDKDIPFQGGSHKFDLKPFDYFFEVRHPVATVLQVDPPPPGPLSLYEPVVVRFKKQPVTRGMVGGFRGGGMPRGGRSPSSTPVAAPRKASVTLEAAPNTEIHLVSAETGKTTISPARLAADVPPGTYTARVMERGVAIQTRQFTVAAGKPVKIDLLERPVSEVRERILQTVSDAGTSRYAAFSETLGPMSNWDLSLWLSVFGASHIVGAPGRFSKLAKLPLDTFTDVKKGASPVYVLAGFEKSKGRFDVALSQGARVKWEPLEKVKSLVGIYQRRVEAKPGPHLLSLRLADQAPVTLAVHCLPNRATFVNFAEDAQGNLKVHQFLLPIHSLFRYLDPLVTLYLDNDPLSIIRTMTLAQSKFASNHPINPEPGTKERQDWQALMYGKWLDPIMSLIACYEMIRRGEAKKEMNSLKIVIQNLRKYFGGIPDTEVIAKLLGLKAKKLDAPPLLLDGVLALEEAATKLLPLPASKLDYNSPWTAWRAAVSDTDSPARKGAKGRKGTPSKKGGASKKGAASKKVAASKKGATA
ncbi:MAG TPA: caspase family protein [Blastocatellia bacterium]|nr:caspase family protein [Blastocatellia bacterium]